MFSQEPQVYGNHLARLEIVKMANEKIESFISTFRELLEQGTDLEFIDVPYVNFKDNIAGKGLIWTGSGNNKQFIFAENPNRFFVSEDLDLAKSKSISINSIKVIDENELGPTITKSNLRELGRLQGLVVDGGMSLNQYLFYDANTDRLGIGTDQPKASISIVDMNIELVLGASDPNVGRIGTFNSADLELITDNTARLTISANGEITLGNLANGPTKVKVQGSLGINVNSIDPRANLHVNGSIKFNDKLHISGSEPPQGGVYIEGDIMWNDNPQLGSYIGWVCIRAGNPGLWRAFGKIE